MCFLQLLSGHKIVVDFVVALLMLATLIFTALAAYAARKSANQAQITVEATKAQAKKSLETQILSGLLDYRYSPESGIAKKEIRKWRDECSKKTKKKGKDLAGYMMDTYYRSRDQSRYRKLNEHRRYFHLYFRKVLDFKKVGFIDDAFIKSILENKSDLELLLEVGKPMEAAKHNEMYPEDKRELDTYEDEMFEYFQDVYREKYERSVSNREE